MKQYLRNVSRRRYEEDYFPARTFSEAARWLEKNYKHKFFLYIDTFDPHEPWDPPKWYVDMYDPNYKGEEVIYPRYWYCDYLSKAELKHCIALYGGEVTLVDNWFGYFLRKMEYLGLFHNTAIIFTSDHGFLLGEQEVIGKAIYNPPEARGKVAAFSYAPLYEEIAHVPFLMYIPGIKGGSECPALVQHCDIMPTVLDLLGIDIPPTVQGKSILPFIKGEKKSIREIVVSAPCIIYGSKGNCKVTVTSEDGWSLLLPASKESDKREETRQIDNEPKIMGGIKELGIHHKYEGELYYLPNDPQQKKNQWAKNKRVRGKLHRAFIEFLYSIGTEEKVIDYWR